MAECLLAMQTTTGSNPSHRSIFRGASSMVELQSSKLTTLGSIPALRSNGPGDCWLGRLTFNQEDVGSNPRGATIPLADRGVLA